jgi:Zn-dependent alcohol dehydrogenase
MKIKAAVLNTMGVEAPYAKSKPLSIEEVELDDPGHGEVLVKIGAAGLCHSDLSVIDGNIRVRHLWCSATKPPASWRSSDRASTTSRSAIM